MKQLNEEAFTLIEVLIVCTMIGVLAAIAVPKFGNSVAMANTAKMQADLETIDTAIVLYEMDNGEPPDEMADLDTYITDLDSLKPPAGKCKTKEGIQEIGATEYTLGKGSGTGANQETRAYCGTWKSSDLGK